MEQSIGTECFFVIGGPCVIESEESAFNSAVFLKKMCERLHVPFIFKSSYDKANRTSVDSFRGPGLSRGLEVLARVRRELNIPVLTDVHSAREAEIAGEVVDVIQVPAFLVRQTDLIVAAGRTGKPVNLKKAQFLAPLDMRQAIAKVRSTGNDRILLTERGTSFGYNNLIVDMRSIPIMRSLGHPVVFDATHSVQIPGGQGNSSGGERQYVASLACAAVAAGADGVFLEMHADPDRALCDGPNSIPLTEAEGLLEKLKALYRVVRDQS
jgi:2-dehydro-3-deoxyphosphooctonate aldolase (KDO 8-P synthase)